ncbi:MAG: tyrosine--tRNA ligase [Candidatus Micrarchaeota archaeon]|nr:tyrosine--tRNA ligase [Candidatus Micrarchaeota archaeon]
MDTESKIALIKGFAEEIVTEQDLRQLFETNDRPIAYDGFEPSGIAPIHFGLLRARNVNKMLKAGIRMKLFLADYFAFLNNKLGGDLDSIRSAGMYFIEVWKAAGIDTSKVEVLWSKDLMDGIDYWDTAFRVAKAITLDRVKRAITIMGRKEGEKLSSAMLFYPVMQVTDVFRMDIDICQMGMEQRRANMLAREVADKYKWKKPVAVHHPLVLGLQGMPEGADTKDPDAFMDYKMSKSNPKSAIYVHDTYDELKKKINGAYCPERVVYGNPMLNYVKLLIVDGPDDPISIERPQKFGGNIELSSYAELERAYSDGKIHPADLKSFVTEGLERQIAPIRKYFDTNRKANELYQLVKGFSITR